jgi:XTP/dITP diphosphohydrolase
MGVSGYRAGGIGVSGIRVSKYSGRTDLHWTRIIAHPSSLIPLQPVRLVLATRNAGKLAELRHVLADLAVELIPAAETGAPEVDEHAETLQGNALLKAETLHAYTGLPALADDTGLEVDALGGAPGVRSARFAGPTADDVANRARLLSDLAAAGAVDPAVRRARFRTVLAYVDHAGPRLFEGVCEGTITAGAAGGAGFGYDPVFVPDEQPAAGRPRTFAEMSSAEKNAVSHRGQALEAFAAWLRDRL